VDGATVREESKTAVADEPFYELDRESIAPMGETLEFPRLCALCCGDASESEPLSVQDLQASGPLVAKAAAAPALASRAGRIDLTLPTSRSSTRDSWAGDARFYLCSRDLAKTGPDRVGIRNRHAVARTACGLAFISYHYYKLFWHQNDPDHARGGVGSAAPAGSASAAGAELEVLLCAKCGGPVPLGDGDSIKCPYCGTLNEVPEDHRRLRDAERKLSSERVQAQELYRRLGTPPGIVLRVWGRISVALIYLLVLPVAFVFDFIAVTRIMHSVAGAIHANLTDVMGDTDLFSLVGIVMYLTIAPALLLGVYGNRRTRARRMLQAALSAMPPARPGGPRLCRSCGAPLDVATGALGQTCPYCGTDNLVAMPESWVQSLRSKARAIGKQIESAGRKDDAMRTRLRSGLKAQSVWLLIWIFVPVIFMGFLVEGGGSWPPSWGRAVKGDRQFISAVREDPTDFKQWRPEPFTLSQDIKPFGFNSSECDKKGCVRMYLLALRYRETLVISAGDFPAGVDGMAVDYSLEQNPLFGGDWKPVSEPGILLPHQSIQFQAPRSAWYRVDFTCPGPNILPRHRIDIAAVIIPPSGNDQTR
jgi:uncharacterized Zn finger protein (UPF0148 family)